MEISYQTILRKMEEKLAEAKRQESEARVREQIQAIKTLCEVILDNTKEDSFAAAAVRSEPVTNIYSAPSSTAVSFGEKKLETDDGANGDSIFDF